MFSAFDNLIEAFTARPVLLILVMAVPLLLVAGVAKVYPTRRALGLVLVPLLLSIGWLLVPMLTFAYSESTARSVTNALSPLIGWTIAVLDGLILILLGVDWGILLFRKSSLVVTRHIAKVASLGKPLHGEIEIANTGQRSCTLTVRDDFPDTVEVDPPEITSTIVPQSRLRFKYECTPGERGRIDLEGVHVRLSSPLGLWHAYRQLTCPTTVNVYPDMKQISEYDLLAKSNRLSLMGLRRTRKIGQDNEFERLRDYTQDDNYKHIDWRTTARRRKLTVRDFQANQSQRVIFLVDCGRMMTGTHGDKTLLDYSLNAMLMLSYVALRQGDNVGMISFSDRIHNFTPVKPGVQHINRLLHASFDQQPEYVESRYDEAFLYLRTKCRKRSLVVLITNVIDEINAQQVRQYLGNVAGHHLPLGVFLRDHSIFSSVDSMDVSNLDSLYQASAAVEILNWRQQAIRDLQHQGVLALDVFPEQLTATMVNQYLKIKAQHWL